MMDRNKAKGMLWGLVVGDAFGSPIQFSGMDSHPWITEMVACPVFGLPPGYWTDDGSMAMCVMDSYVRKGGYDLKDIAGTFVKWLKDGYLSSIEGRSFDVGGATYSSVMEFARTGSLVNGREESQGNGSVMRFAPSYLVARALGRPEIIHEVSDVTHASATVREVCDRFAGVLDEHFAGNRSQTGPGEELKREQGFPSPEQVARMVAAEVKHLAETEYARNRGIEEKHESRRDRLRTAYRLQHKPVGRPVNLDAIFFLVGNVASVTFAAWRGLFALDMVALAEAGTREDFDDMEFLVTRALGELNGIKNLLALARRLA